MAQAGSDSGKELEYKFRVDSEEQLNRLIDREGGHAAAAVRQVNHFFDTKDLALNAPPYYTLRLREEAGGYLLTAKGPERKSADGIWSEKDETERRVEEGDAQAILDGKRSALDVLETLAGKGEPLLETIRRLVGTKPLLHVGSFTNHRASVPVTLEAGGKQRRLVFEIDRTEFPDGHVDHEVEIEVKEKLTAEEQDDVDRAIHERLRKAGIVEMKSAPSKAKRFFDTLSAKTA